MVVGYIKQFSYYSPEDIHLQIKNKINIVDIKIIDFYTLKVVLYKNDIILPYYNQELEEESIEIEEENRITETIKLHIAKHKNELIFKKYKYGEINDDISGLVFAEGFSIIIL